MASKKPEKKQAMVKWDAEFAASAQAASKAVDAISMGSMISTKGGRLTVDGNEVKENKMNVVILAWCWHNSWYKNAYDSDSLQSPDCYAFCDPADDIKTMAPNPDDVHDKQSDLCAGCWANEFGTADRGNGKACGNRVRLAMVPEGVLEDPDQLLQAQIRHLHVPPTSVKGWAGYVKQVAELLKRGPQWVITTVQIIPDQKTQFKVIFAVSEQIDDNKILPALKEKIALANKGIQFKYPDISEEDRSKRARPGKKQRVSAENFVRKDGKGRKTVKFGK